MLPPTKVHDLLTSAQFDRVEQKVYTETMDKVLQKLIAGLPEPIFPYVLTCPSGDEITEEQYLSSIGIIPSRTKYDTFIDELTEFPTTITCVAYLKGHYILCTTTYESADSISALVITDSSRYTEHDVSKYVELFSTYSPFSDLAPDKVTFAPQLYQRPGSVDCGPLSICNLLIKQGIAKKPHLIEAYADTTFLRSHFNPDARGSMVDNFTQMISGLNDHSFPFFDAKYDKVAYYCGIMGMKDPERTLNEQILTNPSTQGIDPLTLALELQSFFGWESPPSDYGITAEPSPPARSPMLFQPAPSAPVKPIDQDKMYDIEVIDSVVQKISTDEKSCHIFPRVLICPTSEQEIDNELQIISGAVPDTTASVMNFSAMIDGIKEFPTTVQCVTYFQNHYILCEVTYESAAVIETLKITDSLAFVARNASNYEALLRNELSPFNGLEHSKVIFEPKLHQRPGSNDCGILAICHLVGNLMTDTDYGPPEHYVDTSYIRQVFQEAHQAVWEDKPPHQLTHAIQNIRDHQHPFLSESHYPALISCAQSGILNPYQKFVEDILPAFPDISRHELETLIQENMSISDSTPGGQKPSTLHENEYQAFEVLKGAGLTSQNHHQDHTMLHQASHNSPFLSILRIITRFIALLRNALSPQRSEDSIVNRLRNLDIPVTKQELSLLTSHPMTDEQLITKLFAIKELIANDANITHDEIELRLNPHSIKP